VLLFICLMDISIFSVKDDEVDVNILDGDVYLSYILGGSRSIVSHKFVRL
jgi:hypothetical protein